MKPLLQFPLGPAPRRLRRLGLALLLGLLGSAACRATDPAAEAGSVLVCLDERDRSPLLFLDAEGRWRGAALELVERALQRAGLRAQWRPLPWGRCLQEVAHFGAPGGGPSEMLLYASRNPDRERDYLISLPLHRLHGGVWYSRRRFAQGPEIRQIADLRHYRLCGLLNSNYTWLRAEGVERIDDGAPSLQVAMRKLQLGRCELVLSTLEQVRGAERSGLLEADPDRSFLAYPGRSPVEQHLMLSRRSPRGAQLLARLNRALEALQRDGSSLAIYQRHLGPEAGAAATGTATR